jgi:phosphoglycolate phosphatase-like HAD superfamily hydrolase
LDHYRDNIPGRSQPYPGVLEALDRLAAAGYLLAVCTNKPEGFARSLLLGLAMDTRFAAICGADPFAFRKPDPRHLTEQIKLFADTVGDGAATKVASPRLDRAELNKLIRSLRTARDKAYGRDE